jgi:penicillin-binding protein 1A
MARRFGITSPLPPYLPIVLGAADLNLMEHTAAFTVFPDDGIRIEPHLIRRVTTYDGAVLEQVRPNIRDVIAPDVARTMVAMLEDVINLGTGQQAKVLMRPAGGKTGTTNDFTDAWFMGFTPQITAGVWVGFDDRAISLGKGETGAKAALPIWIEFMQGALTGLPGEDFPNVTPLEKEAATRQVRVDTPDNAPEGAAEEPPTPATPEDKPTGPPAPSPVVAPTSATTP